jgi:hypothetical protein
MSVDAHGSVTRVSGPTISPGHRPAVTTRLEQNNQTGETLPMDDKKCTNDESVTVV